MAKWRFGERSLTKLHTCDNKLIAVANEALKGSPIDLTILEGHRTRERQIELFNSGMSKIDGESRLSKHQWTPSLAVDIAPYPIDWKDINRFFMMAGVVLSSAERLGVALRWGGDWDMDGDFKDQDFFDLPHFELRE